MKFGRQLVGLNSLVETFDGFVFLDKNKVKFVPLYLVGNKIVNNVIDVGN